MLTFIACTNMKAHKELRKSWIGRSAEELKTHPYFSKLKSAQVKGQTKFADGSPILTSARDQGLGGAGSYESWCEHYFTIVDGKITAYEPYGPCPYNAERLPLKP